LGGINLDLVEEMYFAGTFARVGLSHVDHVIEKNNKEQKME
jgi:hypothetical protein